MFCSLKHGLTASHHSPWWRRNGSSGKTAERQHLGMCRRDEGEQEFDVSSAARFTKLEKTSFNPTGTVVRPFLCQFSPSHWFKHPLSSCSSSMQRRAFLSFLCSLVSFLCVIHPTKNPRQHVVYVNDPPFMLKVEWDLSNITHTYARTHTHPLTAHYLKNPN